MAVQQSKVSKRRVRIRKAANRYKGVQINHCTSCGAACLPHHVCKKCGIYDGRQVLSLNQDDA
ncbi:MAG: 50S ribosomal protein L32 [Lentisphaerae bacterium]|jgi:large subunit ribosomal protein L32|nr:50S ribosomal protein L32 [Lentisphaerota bacterium]